MRSGLASWRAVAALAGLVVFTIILARLAPLYFKNLELQRFLDDTVQETSSATAPDDMLRARIVDRASRLGLPVRGDQIRVDRAGGRLVIDLRYAVPVDFGLSSVDLHFRPRAGAR